MGKNGWILNPSQQEKSPMNQMQEIAPFIKLAPQELLLHVFQFSKSDCNRSIRFRLTRLTTSKHHGAGIGSALDKLNEKGFE